MWAIPDGCAALLDTKITTRKQKHEATQWEAARGTNIGLRMNDGVGRSKKKVALT